MDLDNMTESKPAYEFVITTKEDIEKYLLDKHDLYLQEDEKEVYEKFKDQFTDFIFDNWDDYSIMHIEAQYIFMWETFKQNILGLF